MELVVTFYSDDKDPDSPITYSVQCPDLGTNSRPFPFKLPLTGAELAEIRWYLEEYWRWPTDVDYARAHKLEAGLEAMGRRLWLSLFDPGETAPGN